MTLDFDHIIADNQLHARFLNTLSYLENCGARKIAAFEHPLLVKKEILKHAAEEFRHAHHFKKQITRLDLPAPDDYQNLLGSYFTIHYLDHLEACICRILKEPKKEAYFYVTYAIEKRAEALYPIYEQFLRKHKSRVTVRSIILEEEGHLSEIEMHLKSPLLKSQSLLIEEKLYKKLLIDLILIKA